MIFVGTAWEDRTSETVAVCSDPECGSEVRAMAEDRADVLAALDAWVCDACGAAWAPVEPGTQTD